MVRKGLLGLALAGTLASLPATAATSWMGPTAGQKSVILRGGIGLPGGDLKLLMGTGIHLGLVWRAQFSEYVGMEGEISWMMMSRKPEGTLHLVTPQILFLRVQVPIAIVVPFLLLGGGLNTPMLFTHDNTDFGFNVSMAFGGGVEVYLGPTTSLGLDAQYRRHFEQGGANLSYTQVGLRVGFHY